MASRERVTAERAPLYVTDIGEYLWAMDVAESGPYKGHPVFAHLIVRVEQGRFGEIRHGACGRTFTAGTHPRGWWSTKPGNLPLQGGAIHCGAYLAKTGGCVTESVVHGEIHLDRISHKGTRDALRQAADAARHGDPVWIVSKAGDRIGAVVSAERAAAMLERQRAAIPG